MARLRKVVIARGALPDYSWAVLGGGSVADMLQGLDLAAAANGSSELARPAVRLVTA